MFRPDTDRLSGLTVLVVFVSLSEEYNFKIGYDSFFPHVPSNSYFADRPTIRRFVVPASGSVCKRLNVSPFPLSQQIQLQRIQIFHG
jgi:hypothetical protein